MPDNPTLSVVVTAVSGGESLRRTLGRLLHIAKRDWMEVLVPLEANHLDRASLATAFPEARFPVVDLGAEASDHERYDRRRTRGITESHGAIIAIVEDHGTPAADWPERVRDAHARLPHAVIGGVVANGVMAAFNDAVWLCDFGRYAPPQAEGPRSTLTDVNVSYKREALLAVRQAWEPRYHEPVVHAALQSRGAALWLDPAIVVTEERPRLGLRRALAERFTWGRLFGTLRARVLRGPMRLLYTVVSLFIAPVLLWRIWRSRRGRIGLGRLLAAIPWMVTLLLAWGLGEAVGTFTGSYNPTPKQGMR